MGTNVDTNVPGFYTTIFTFDYNLKSKYTEDEIKSAYTRWKQFVDNYRGKHVNDSKTKMDFISDYLKDYNKKGYTDAINPNYIQDILEKSLNSYEPDYKGLGGGQIQKTSFKKIAQKSPKATKITQTLNHLFPKNK